ncbi:MAG: glycosyltransferase [Cyanophyceae cyanobacterium]
MHIGFLNPQGNFDPNNSHIAKHPDFGGQLVYVKQVAIAMAQEGHRVDILTRRIVDPEWPEFSEFKDVYPGVENLRILRLPAGPEAFVRKELLWPHLVRDWVPSILKFYREEGTLPDAFTTHYSDGGLAGVLIEEQTGIPFTFTAHSLGAQKMDKLEVTPENIKELDDYYSFRYRIIAERLSMNRSAVNITSTQQERFEQYGHRAYQGAVEPSNDTRFSIIPPGVNPKIFGADVRASDEADIHKLVQEKLVRDIDESRRELPAIVASSRLAPKKNVAGLVEAFAKSESLQEQANFVLITSALDNPFREQADDEATEKVLAPIREMVQDQNLWGKISAFSIPSQAALAATYRFLAKRRSVFALTSHFEPFGLAPLEAVVAGLPVIVTQNSGLADDLREGEKDYAILVDPAEPTDMARGLEELVSNPQRWEELLNNAQQHVLTYYTWEATAKNYLEIIKQIVAEPSSRRAENLLSIPEYFKEPSDKDISLEQLQHLYFEAPQAREKE